MLNPAGNKRAPAIAIERPGRRRVRRAIGHDEQKLHMYVVDVPGGAEAFDATAEDLAAEDWQPVHDPAERPTRPSQSAKTVS